MDQLVNILLNMNNSRVPSPSLPPVSSPSTVSKIPNISLNGVNGFVQALPANYDSSGSTKYNLLIWLHGQGEGGNGSDSDLNKIFNTSIMDWLKNNSPDSGEWIVLAPQSNSGFWGGNPNTRTHVFFDYVLNSVNGIFKNVVNYNSIHLMGYSAGGFGIAEFILENGQYYQSLSTIASLSGNLNASNDHAQRIIDNNQHLWNHNSDTDTIVPPGASESFFKNVYDLDNSRARQTTYISRNHSQMQDVLYDNSGRSLSQNTGTFDGSYPYYEWLAPESYYQWAILNRKQ